MSSVSQIMRNGFLLHDAQCRSRGPPRIFVHAGTRKCPAWTWSPTSPYDAEPPSFIVIN